MSVFTIPKGCHYAWPPILKIRKGVTEITWAVVFDESCRYYLDGGSWTDDSDQMDWNKLCGLSFRLFSNRQDSVMGAWRYNPLEGIIELTPYYHVAGETIKGPDNSAERMAITKIGDIVFVYISIDYVHKKYIVMFKTIENLTPGDAQSFSHNRKTSREINCYFGGNERAPNRMKIRKNIHLVNKS